MGQDFDPRSFEQVQGRWKEKMHNSCLVYNIPYGKTMEVPTSHNIKNADNLRVCHGSIQVICARSKI